jgi:gamma-glutamyl-gamma-aminobutyrate hydrolase PuuD
MNYKVIIALSTSPDANDLKLLVEQTQKKFPFLLFERVTYEELSTAISKGHYYDGWLNPGSNDSFPVHMDRFNKSEWLDCNTTKLELDSLYQGIMSHVHGHKIPTFGICGGAQHLVLYNEGFIKPVSGFRHAVEKILYKGLTLSSFFAMDTAEQKEALYNCTSSDFVINAVTINSFAAVSGNIGGLLLGAVAHRDESVAKAYAHKSGLHTATQYHLEKHYTTEPRQTNIIDNFVKQAAINKSGKLGAFYPVDILYEAIAERISECSKLPTCEYEVVADQSFLKGNVSEVNYQDYFMFDL